MPKYENESYSRCVSALRARYGSRGINATTRNEAGNNGINKAKSTPADNYYVYNTRSGIASTYRSGEHKGNKYMTSEDFVRYFRNRNSFVLPTMDRADNAPAKGNASAREGSSDSKEGHIRRALLLLKGLKDKWLPVESKEGRTVGRAFKFPVAAMSCIAVFSISLVLIVSGSVMIGNASGEIGSLNTKIAVLEARQSELQSQLDLKYDIESVKADAEDMGMISGEFAGGQYLKSDNEEEIEIYEENDAKFGLSALLSAFGIEID